MQALLIDTISWIGLALCIGAFFVKDMFWLRICTATGAALLAIYYSYITIPQGMVSNILVLAINAVYLSKSFVDNKKQPNATKELKSEELLQPS